MPSWKKIIASGSDASFSSATVDTYVSASSFKGSFTGSLFGTASQALTASYLVGAAAAVGFPYTGSAQITGSLGVTGSITTTGALGIGTTSSLTGYSLRVSKNITGFVNSAGIVSDGVIQSDVANTFLMATNATTVAAPFTQSSLTHYRAAQGTFGAGSVVNDQYGFIVVAGLTGAVNNYGFRSLVSASGNNNWNVYMDGSAPNYLLGSTGVGKLPSAGAQLDISGSTLITGSLNVSGTISAQLANVSQPNFVAYNTTTGLFTYANTGSFTATSASYSATASYVNPLRQTVIISGSLIVSASSTPLSIQGSGSNVFSVDGTSGRLFQIDDSLSGSLFSVNTTAGLPVIEAFSDNTVRIGQFGQKALFVSQSRVGVGTEIPTTNLDVSGSGRFTNGLSLTGSVQITGSLGVTGSINSTGNITTTGTLTAQTLVVQTITSSITYSSGSNIFGNSTANTQTMTGSLNVSGSATIVGRVTATDLTGSLFGTASQALTASYSITSNVAYSGTGSFTGSFIGVHTGSLFGTASQALTASYLLGGGGVVTFPYSGSAQITGSLGVTGSFSVSGNVGTVFSSNADTLLFSGSLIVTGSTSITGILAVTGSVYISGSLLLNQSTSSLGISTQTVSTNATASYTSVFYNYTLASGSNARAGQMIAVWSGSAIQYMDNSTTDIGNTSLVALTASLSSGNVLLTTVLPTAGWTVKTLVNLL